MLIATAEIMSEIMGLNEKLMKRFQQQSLDLTVLLRSHKSVKCCEFLSIYVQCLEGNKLAKQLITQQMYETVMQFATNPEDDEDLDVMVRELCEIHPKIMLSFMKESMSGKPAETTRQFFAILPQIAQHIEVKEKEAEQIMKQIMNHVNNQDKNVQLAAINAIDQISNPFQYYMKYMQNLILQKLFDVFQQTTDVEVKKAIMLAFNGYMGVCEDIEKYK